MEDGSSGQPPEAPVVRIPHRLECSVEGAEVHDRAGNCNIVERPISTNIARKGTLDSSVIIVMLKCGSMDEIYRKN